LPSIFAEYANAPLFDQEHRSGRIALTHDDLARRDVARLELGEHDGHHRVGRQAREGGKPAEESLQLAMLALQLEIGADVGIRVDELEERRALEAQRDDVAARAARWPARPGRPGARSRRSCRRRGGCSAESRRQCPRP
jgi:hypothetical protein